MIFEAPQIFTARIDVLIDGTSVNGFPVDIDIFNESLDFSPVFWESDVDVSLSGKKRSNIRGYDLLLRLDYEHTLEPDKFDAIYEQLPNAIRYDTEIRLYPDATDTERYYAVVPTSSTVQSVMYESTVKGTDKPTLEFENVELLDSVASYGSPSSAGGDADTLNGFTADDFLKSDANDTYESGNTLTFNGDVNLQGVVSVGNLGGTPFSIGGVRLFENGDEQKLGVNESPQFAGLAIGNAIGDPFTVGGIRIFDAGDEQELGTSASPTFGGATFNGNFTAPDYNPSAWDDASDRSPTLLSVNASGVLTLTRFNTTNLQADLQAWADTRYTQSSQIDSNWDTAYDRSVTDFRLVTNSLEIVRENAATLDVNLGTWGAGLYFQKALNLSEGDPATMRNNLELGSSDSPTFAGLTLTGALSGTSATFSDTVFYPKFGNPSDTDTGLVRNLFGKFVWTTAHDKREIRIPYNTGASVNAIFTLTVQGEAGPSWGTRASMVKVFHVVTDGTTGVISRQRNYVTFKAHTDNISISDVVADTGNSELVITVQYGQGNRALNLYMEGFGREAGRLLSATVGGLIAGTAAEIPFENVTAQTEGVFDTMSHLNVGGVLQMSGATAIDSSRNASFVGGTFTNTLTTSTIENSSAVKIRGNFKGYGDSNAFPNTHMDARLRDGDDNAVWHKYLRNSTDDAYNPYYERWFNGSAYRSIGINAALNFYVGTRFEATGFLISGTTVIDSSRNASFAGGTFTGAVKMRNDWSSTTLSNNSFYVQNSTDGFAFGVGTAASSWFSWDDVAGQKRAIDVWNDGSRILLGIGGADVGIGTLTPAFKLDVTGTGRFTGDVDILGNDGLDVRRGLTGGYNDTTDSGSNWGANIWGIGDAYTSSGHGSGFSLGNHYGLAWLRPAHPDRVGSSEGLYVYRVGNLLAHFGSERAYIREPLGIGVLSPSEQLDVNGNVQADDFILT